MIYIDKIKDERLRKAVKKVYSKYGYKLHFLPSSFTGHHHPPDERGLDGLKKHIEKVCWFLDCVADEFLYSDEVRDILLTAAYFHDIGKVEQIKVNEELILKSRKAKHQVRIEREVKGPDLHAQIGVAIATEYLKEQGVDFSMIKTITEIIDTHMGHWYYKKPLTELQRMFALADFVVSRDEFRIGRKESRWTTIRKKLKR